jgi:hypothetical protein
LVLQGHNSVALVSFYGGVIARTIKNKTRKEINKKIYKIMTFPVLLCDSQTWTPRKRDWNRIHAAEMKYLRTVKGCTRLDQIRNEDIRNELGISPLTEKKWNTGIKGKNICKEWNIPAFRYSQPSGKRDTGRPRRRW